MSTYQQVTICGNITAKRFHGCGLLLMHLHIFPITVPYYFRIKLSHRITEKHTLITFRWSGCIINWEKKSLWYDKVKAKGIQSMEIRYNFRFFEKSNPRYCQTRVLAMPFEPMQPNFKAPNFRY